MKRIFCLMLCLVMAASLLVGCGETETEEKLIWYARINKQAANEEVFAKVDEYVKSKIGMGVEIVVLEDYATKMPVIAASNEDYDIVYTSSTINNYFKNAANGDFLALDELLPQYAPNLWNMFGEDVWNAMRVGGKLYGVTNQQIMARGPALYIPKRNVELLGLDLEEYKELNLDTVEKYLRLVKEKTGSYSYVPDFWTGGGSQMWGIEQVVGSNLPGAIRITDENPVVFDQYKSPEFKEYAEKRIQWVQEGLTAPVHTLETDFKKFADTPEGEIIPILGCTRAYQPGMEENFVKQYGFEVQVITVSEPILNSYGIAATMTAVNSATRYPEKSVEFLELLHTDPYLFNLIAYGIEGKHYEKTGENTIKVISQDYAQPTWAISNLFNSYIVEGNDPEMWNKMKEINDTAVRSPLLGFVPDTDEVKLEIANCNAALDEYLDVVCEGLMDMATYDAFVAKLDAAGSEKIMNAVNNQVNNWKVSK